MCGCSVAVSCSLGWEGQIREFNSNSLIANGALTSEAVIPVHGLLLLDYTLGEIITEWLIPEAGGFEASLQLEEY